MATRSAEWKRARRRNSETVRRFLHNDPYRAGSQESADWLAGYTSTKESRTRTTPYQMRAEPRVWPDPDLWGIGTQSTAGSLTTRARLRPSRLSQTLEFQLTLDESKDNVSGYEGE